jgi:ABC-type sugar transport system ATPase subunit
MMVGRTVDLSSRPARAFAESVVLSASGLTTRKLRDVSFDLRRGEVLGFAGLVGAGRSEVGAALFGLDPIQRGSLRLFDKPYAPSGPAQAQHLGMGLVPEDRKLQGLMPHMSVRDNSTLIVAARLSRWGFVRTAREQELFDRTARRLRLKCASSSVAVNTLSGGNQQKTLLARWLLAKPSVLFLDDPARGIDVGAKEDIYHLIDELAAGGTSILLASSELTELLRCADRILVLNDGRVAGVLSAAQASQEAIMALATRAPLARVG